MKKIIMPLSILVFMTACKVTQNMTPTEKEGTGIGPVKAVSERDYTPSEIEIGRRVCRTLKQKREFFETLTNEREKFKFDGMAKNCDQGMYLNSQFIASISNANSTDLEFVADRANYLRDVITDQSGPLKFLCETLTKTDKVSNTVVMGNSSYTLNFYIADGYDRLEMTKSNKLNGKLSAVSSDAISFVTQSIQADSKFYGVEKERWHFTKCEGQNRFSTIKQTWLGATTSF